MKKIALCFNIILLLLAGSDKLKAQNIQPDQSFASNVDDLVWYPNGTSFCSYNGKTYLFVWTREEPSESYDYFNWYPYVYEFVNGDFQPFMVKNSQKLQFHYKHEDGEGYAVPYRRVVTIQGNSFAFSYYGQLWFSCLIEHPPYPNYYPGDLYYQLWARYDNDIEGWVTWYDSLKVVPTTWKMGACQVDSNLQIFSWDENTNRIIAEEYKFNGTTKKLDYVKKLPLSIAGNRFGGVIAYKDTLDQQCYVYTSYQDEKGYTTTFSPSDGYRTTTASAGAITICEGSVKGMRSSETTSPQMSRRYNTFLVSPVKNSGATYDLQNVEMGIPENPAQQHLSLHSVKVGLPATNCLQKLDGEFQIGSSSMMIPGEYAPEVSGLDGMKQQIQVFYPDKNGRIYGGFFTSDTWRPVPNSSVQSTDLKDDSIYGPEVRKLWTLVGLTDGAPPCAIDWPVWYNWHFAEDATKFSFTIGQTCNSEVSSTYEDAYSLGAKMEVTAGKIMKSEYSFKYTNSYKSMVKSGSEVSAKISKNFGLNEASQEYGYYIWMIPDISRTSYRVYPWYDTTMQYPVTNSLQYQFRTETVMLKTENIAASKFPFLINEPNDPQMEDWTEDSRQTLVNSAFYAGVKPLFSLTYTSPNPGDIFNFDNVNTTVSSVETKNSYEAGAGITFIIPKVFKITGSAEGEISYSTELTYESKFGTEVEVSMEPLTDAAMFGIHNPEFDVDLYWFKPNVSHWWYIDSLGGQKPWYFAYIASIDKARIVQQSPEPDSRLKEPDLVFTWDTVNGSVGDFVFFISTESVTGPGSTVYQHYCGDRMMARPLDFIPEPSRTYYWSVRGITQDGDVKWSTSRPFKVGEPQKIAEVPLKAEVYPNPGVNGQLYVTYALAGAGNVSFDIFDIGGRLVQRCGQAWRPAGIGTEVLHLDGYEPGIYLVVIRTELSSVTRKLVIRK